MIALIVDDEHDHRVSQRRTRPAASFRGRDDGIGPRRSARPVVPAALSPQPQSAWNCTPVTKDGSTFCSPNRSL